MSGRLSRSLVLSGALLLLAGCGGRTERQEESAPTDSKRVTLHVKDMHERLDLL
jgi:hypothetical protein